MERVICLGSREKPSGRSVRSRIQRPAFVGRGVVACLTPDCPAKLIGLGLMLVEGVAVAGVVGAIVGLTTSGFAGMT